MSKQDLDNFAREELAKHPVIEQVGTLLSPDDGYDQIGDEEQQADWEWTIENTMGANAICNLQFPKSTFNR